MNKSQNYKDKSLFIVFKYVTIGTGIIGIGLLIAFLGYIFLYKS